MSRAVPPIVANTDFNQWQSWQTVTTPGGDRTYYVVPGYNGQYVFDPYESDATGSIMIYRNPKPVYDRAEEERKQAEKANSITAQLAPVAGTAVGAIGAGYVADTIANWGSSAAGGAAQAAGTGAATGAATTGATGAAGAGTTSAVTGAAQAGTDAASGIGGMFSADGAISQALPYLGAAAGAYGLYDLFEGADYKGQYAGRAAQGAASGAAIGSAFGGIGAIPGALIGGALGLIAGFAGSGKSRHQVARDQWRKEFQNAGLLDKDFNFTLADGRKFDLGRDGRGWTYKGKDGRTYKSQFEVDFSDPRRGYAAGAINPLMDILTQGGYSTGEVEAAATPAASFINMLAEGAGDVGYVNENARNLYEKLGFNQEKMFNAINQLAESGKISKEQQLAYHNAVNVAYGEEFGTGRKIDQSDVPDFTEMESIADQAVDESGNIRPEIEEEFILRQPYRVDPEQVQMEEQSEQLAAMMDNRVPLGEQRQPFSFAR